ncbi:hypothetical protein Tco_1066615 [Tanacetum coccineum]|uniref:Retrotransposon gag domain-containing protein n=1 Tax=Tanacetum coccineum TaxID=301880 RepID=A0ABQ5HAZ4_9ASTR
MELSGGLQRMELPGYGDSFLYTVLVEQSIRRIIQLNMVYQPFTANASYSIQKKYLREYSVIEYGRFIDYCCANSEDLIEEGVTETIMKPTLREYMKEVQVNYGSNTTTPRFNENAKFKIGGEFLKILHDNAFNGTNGDDVVDHTTKVLAILDLIKIPNVDPDELRIHVFPLSLTGAAQKWWIDEVDGKITTWEGLMEKFFHKY